MSSPHIVLNVYKKNKQTKNSAIGGMQRLSRIRLMWLVWSKHAVTETSEFER